MKNRWNRCHESEKLNRLLGKNVRVVFFDGDIREGVLRRSKYQAPYRVGNLVFYKSHVIRVEEVQPNGNT